MHNGKHAVYRDGWDHYSDEDINFSLSEAIGRYKVAVNHGRHARGRTLPDVKAWRGIYRETYGNLPPTYSRP